MCSNLPCRAPTYRFSKSNIEDIDAVIREMVNPDPVARMSCEDLLNKLRDVVYNVPPEQLHVAPTITLMPYY